MSAGFIWHEGCSGVGGVWTKEREERRSGTESKDELMGVTRVHGERVWMTFGGPGGSARTSPSTTRETGGGAGGNGGLYLGLVALLRTEAGSRRVELLGNHAQELRLVFRAVAVRRADVHHLDGGKRGGVSEERPAEKEERC